VVQTKAGMPQAKRGAKMTKSKMVTPLITGAAVMFMLLGFWESIASQLPNFAVGTPELNWKYIGIGIVLLVTAYGWWYDDSKPTGAIWFSWAVKAVVVVVALGILIFGVDSFKNPTQQGLFVGNKPNGMGWTNIDGDFIVVPGLTPHDCVPDGHDAFDANGNIFAFHLTDERGDNACYKNGIALLPNSQENTPDVSGLTPQGLVGKLTTTPAEREAEEAAEKKKSETRSNRPVVLAPTPRAPEFAEECDGYHATAMSQGRLVECYTGTLFADGEDLFLSARDDACFSTNKNGLVKVENIDVLTIDPHTGAQSAGPDGQAETYRVSTRHGNTVTGVKVWYTKDTKTFQRYTCNKGT